jgi:kynurenine formamidase
LTRFVDLSHEIEDGMPVFPGLPTPHIGAHLTHEASREKYDDAEFFLGKVDMPANVGTYIDSPFHRFSDREDLSQIPLEGIVGLRGVLVDASKAESRELRPQLPDVDLRGTALLIRTRWDRNWGTEAYFGAAPYLAEAFAAEIIDRNVGLVGVDSWNVDDTTTRRRPIHTALLDAGIYIVEHLRALDALPANGFRFFAPVIAVRGGASFAIRAFAELTSRDR